MEGLITITLTPEQISNLNTFLNRTELKGAEVGAFIEILRAINEGTAAVEEK